MKDIFEQLMEEHELMAELIDELLDTDDGETEVRAELVAQLRAALLAHSQAEQSELYYPVRELDPSLATVVDDHLEEHDELDDLLGELAECPLEGETILDVADELRAAFEDHVDDEENELFPQAREYVDDAHAAVMGERYRAERLRRLESLHIDRYDDMTAEELYEEARDREITGRSNMNRDELITELRHH